MSRRSPGAAAADWVVAIKAARASAGMNVFMGSFHPVTDHRPSVRAAAHRPMGRRLRNEASHRRWRCDAGHTPGTIQADEICRYAARDFQFGEKTLSKFETRPASGLLRVPPHPAV